VIAGDHAEHIGLGFRVGFTVVSTEPVISLLPERSHPTEQTPRTWPFSVRSTSSVSTFQTLTLLSEANEADASWQHQREQQRSQAPSGKRVAYVVQRRRISGKFHGAEDPRCIHKMHSQNPLEETQSAPRTGRNREKNGWDTFLTSGPCQAMAVTQSVWPLRVCKTLPESSQTCTQPSLLPAAILVASFDQATQRHIPTSCATRVKDYPMMGWRQLIQLGLSEAELSGAVLICSNDCDARWLLHSVC